VLEPPRAARQRWLQGGGDAEALRRQAEYYLSDENLSHDRFFHDAVHASEGGWVSLDVLVACPRMRRMGATVEALAGALAASMELELRADRVVVRRKRPPPALRPLPPEEQLEPSLADKPLHLLRDSVSGWEAVLDDPGRRSFCSVLRSTPATEVLAREFEAIRAATPWRRLRNESGCTRSTAWFVLREGCACSYTYGSTTVEAMQPPEVLRQI